MKIKFLDGAKREFKNLIGANLIGADLRGANLRGADLYGADLYGADLYGAYLRDANLSGADLRDADLRDADLRDAEVRGAYLRGAYLQGANLYGAGLRDADLQDANLRDAKTNEETRWPHFQIPQRGKICSVWKALRDGKLAQLTIPANARRTATPVGRKCRAEYAKVHKIFNRDGTEAKSGFDMHSGSLKYEVGKIVRPDSYDDDFKVECTHGIHFFLTREEAEEWS